MSEIYNIYCDESNHLENDQKTHMVLGAVWSPLEKARKVADKIREIKIQHGLPGKFEIKWTKKANTRQAPLRYLAQRPRANSHKIT